MAIKFCSASNRASSKATAAGATTEQGACGGRKYRMFVVLWLALLLGCVVHTFKLHHNMFISSLNNNSNSNSNSNSEVEFAPPVLPKYKDKNQHQLSPSIKSRKQQEIAALALASTSTASTKTGSTSTASTSTASTKTTTTATTTTTKSTTTTTATNHRRRPLNIVVFFPDDMSHKSLQDVSGADYVQTPFLSALAADGVRFTRNAVTSSICWMSRATLFTGQYVSRHGSERLNCPRFTLPQYWKNTWAAIVQRVGGYHVGHIGKWQYYNGKGLDKYFDYFNKFEGRHWFWAPGLGRLSASDMASVRAIEFLKQRPKDRPFALTVAFYPPKAVGQSYEPGGQWSPSEWSKMLYANKTYERPYDVDKAHKNLPDFLQSGITRNRYDERWNSTEMYNVGMQNYHALVTEVDRACQQIVDELKNQSVYEDTMIIFSSDNGLMMGSHGLGGKWIAYEDSIRVPLIIYDPRMPQEKRGTTDDSMTLNIDLAETILGAANIDPPSTMQGRDISDLYLPAAAENEEAAAKKKKKKLSSPLEEKPWRTDFFYEFPNYDIPSSFALIQEQYKYIDWPRAKHEQLFDLKKDPYELNDLLNDKTSRTELETTGVLERVKKRYKELRDEIQEPNKAKPEDWCNGSLPYP